MNVGLAFNHLKGNPLSELAFNDRQTVLKAPNGFQLTVELTRADTLEFRVEQSDTAQPIISESDDIAVIFGEYQFVWNRNQLARQYLGRNFIKLFWNGASLYVYFANSPCLCFSIADVLKSGTALLYWDEQD